MHGFSKEALSELSNDTLLRVSIPDGDAWVFKAGEQRDRQGLTIGFNPRWGCMGFQRQHTARRLAVATSVSIPDGDAWVFKAGRSVGATAEQHHVSIPDGDAWVFKVAAKHA